MKHFHNIEADIVNVFGIHVKKKGKCHEMSHMFQDKILSFGNTDTLKIVSFTNSRTQISEDCLKLTKYVYAYALI